MSTVRQELNVFKPTLDKIKGGWGEGSYDRSTEKKVYQETSAGKSKTLLQQCYNDPCVILVWVESVFQYIISLLLIRL